MSKEKLQENLAKAQGEIQKKKAAVKQGKMRQKFHFMAESGWINDPNGLIFYQGKYHLFYQHNPYEAAWGAMHWGHAVSSDLVCWEYLPLALAPSETYDDCERGGCFSGSAIERDGRLFLIYTGTWQDESGFRQSQCVAYSDDGIHFEKYDMNPVIPEPPEGFDPANFRDPKVWEHEGTYYMVCGGKKDDLAQALLYRSADLLHWEFFNVLAESRGELGFMWECPDFYPLGDKYVLMFSPMGVHERTAVYLVGDMNYETGKFTYTTVGEMDWGFDFYAPQSFTDSSGRRLIIAWANGWDWMPWWKDWGPAYKEGWCGSYNIPREVILCDDNTLRFKPVEELKTLRKEACSREAFRVKSEPELIETKNGSVFELQLTIDLKQTTAKSFDLILRSDGHHQTVAHFDLEHQTMGVDRSEADGWSKGTTKSPLILADKELMQIQIYVDQSSIEIFTDDYKTNHSLNVFASENQNQNYIAAHTGELYISSITTWELKQVTY